MNSFQSKIGWKRMGMGENKNYHSVSFLPMRNRKCQKITKKLKKLKNSNMNTFRAKIGWKRMRKREIKIIISFLSYLTRSRKFQKNKKKIQKTKKYHCGFISNQNRQEKAAKERK